MVLKLIKNYFVSAYGIKTLKFKELCLIYMHPCNHDDWTWLHHTCSKDLSYAPYSLNVAFLTFLHVAACLEYFHKENGDLNV